MISLDKARELKEAGLVWEPKEGDWYYSNNTKTTILADFDRAGDIISLAAQKSPGWLVWLPSLSQLLAEIEARGIMYKLGCARGNYRIDVSDGILFVGGFDADTPDNAAADALIWILKGALK
jgi:hypothetical protein